MTEYIWAKSGAQFTDTVEKRAEIEAEIASLEWHEVAPGLEAPGMQGEALKAVMCDVPGRHVAVAWNGIVNRHDALLGLETHYKDGIAKSYWLDWSDRATSLCHTFTPREV